MNRFNPRYTIELLLILLFCIGFWIIVFRIAIDVIKAFW